MAKLITKKESAVTQPETYVEIKHLKTMKDEAGKDVSVVDWVDSKPVDAAIKEAEAEKVDLEAKIAEVDANLVEYNAIKDAE